MTQTTLGNALYALGEREREPARFEDALVAHKFALKGWAREQVPLKWALVQTNLGNAFSALGRFEAAIEAYHAALEELLGLGAQDEESGTALLEEARSLSRGAGGADSRRVPLDWAVSIGNQGIAMMAIAVLTNDIVLAEAAVRQIEAAYETTRSGGHKQWAAYYQGRLAAAQAVRDQPTPMPAFMRSSVALALVVRVPLRHYRAGRLIGINVTAFYLCHMR
jgi:tetratricopeptide (TPR) repeat protein